MDCYQYLKAPDYIFSNCVLRCCHIYPCSQIFAGQIQSFYWDTACFGVSFGGKNFPSHIKLKLVMQIHCTDQQKSCLV